MVQFDCYQPCTFLSIQFAFLYLPRFFAHMYLCNRKKNILVCTGTGTGFEGVFCLTTLWEFNMVVYAVCTLMDLCWLFLANK